MHKMLPITPPHVRVNKDAYNIIHFEHDNKPSMKRFKE